MRYKLNYKICFLFFMFLFLINLVTKSHDEDDQVLAKLENRRTLPKTIDDEFQIIDLKNEPPTDRLKMKVYKESKKKKKF